MTALKMQEQENVDLLTGMMGDLDPDVARRLLRKHDGDVQKAATAMLEGDINDILADTTPELGTVTTYTDPPSTSSIRQVTPKHPSAVIDLTAESDDDELARALKASLDPPPETLSKFRPSDRAPNPEWAVVRSNAEADAALSHDDQTLSRAIEASLSSSYNDFADEASDGMPFEGSVREGGRPVALRPGVPTFSYAALLLQALFFVPQVRASVATLRPAAPSGGQNPHGNPEFALWWLSEIFVNLDLAQISVMDPDALLESLKLEPWTGMIQRPGELSTRVLEKLAHLIEAEIHQQYVDETPRPRLFNFRYGRVALAESTVEAPSSETCIVNVDVGGPKSVPNDLISRLASDLSRYFDDGSTHDVIYEPSDVVVFGLRAPRDSASSPADKLAPGEFRFPRSLYLDQFLHENLQLANRKRAQQRDMHAEIQKLTLQRKSLTQFNDKDTLKDLRTAIHYYEYVADAKGNTERQASIDRTAARLRQIASTIESQVQEIDARIVKLTEESAVVFDIPELQKHKYDLRAVLMHNGLYGRKNIYSYVQDKGTWWKTVDYTVTEALEETVLTDPTGIHLGAGPYMLMYSRSIPDDPAASAELPWPQKIKDTVEVSNRAFLSSLPADLAAKSSAHTAEAPPAKLTSPHGKGKAADVMDVSS